MTNIRSKIKHNFLKQVIFTLQYKGVLEQDLEMFIINNRALIYDKGYDVFNTGYKNEVEVNIDGKIDVNNPLVTNNTRTTRIYKFSNKNRDYIEISDKRILFYVNAAEEYINFDTYISLIVDLSCNMAKISEFFSVIKCSLKKDNICFLNQLNDFSEYFTVKAFPYKSIQDLDSQNEYLSGTYYDIFGKEFFKIVYMRKVLAGFIKNEGYDDMKIFQTTLEFEIFDEDIEDIQQKLCSAEKFREAIVEMNTELFGLFHKSITQVFLDKLMNTEFTDENIKGVK